MPQEDDQSYNAIYKLYYDIARYNISSNKLENLQDLQKKRLRKEQKINLLEKHGNQTLGGEVLNLAVEWNNPRVVEFLLININKEQSKLDLNSKEYKEYKALTHTAYGIANAGNTKLEKEQIVLLFMDYERQRIIDIADRKTLQESKSKKSKDFYTSLGQDGIAVISTVELIAISSMQPSDAFKAVFVALATLVAIGTGLHIKNSTVPSYVEMQENSVVNLRDGILKLYI